MQDTTPPPPPQWIPLSALRSRFVANLNALAGREPAISDALLKVSPRQTYQISAVNDQIQIGVTSDATVQPLPVRLPAANARKLIAGLYPTGFCDQPLLIAGEDLGWLIDGVYRLASRNPLLPHSRWPLYFLVCDVERLWVMLHVQQWQQLLADPRVRLFVGESAAEQFQRSLVDDNWCPWPKLAVTVDPATWGASNFDEVVLAARATFDAEVLALRTKAGSDGSSARGNRPPTDGRLAAADPGNHVAVHDVSAVLDAGLVGVDGEDGPSHAPGCRAV